MKKHNIVPQFPLAAEKKFKRSKSNVYPDCKTAQLHFSKTAAKIDLSGK
jgi:hypothetical protein